MADEERRDRSTPAEDLSSEYTVYDMHYGRIGMIDDLFVDENDSPDYVGAIPKLGSFAKEFMRIRARRRWCSEQARGSRRPPRRDLVSSQSTFSTSTPAS